MFTTDDTESVANEALMLAFDPDAATEPQPMYKVLRDTSPVMPIDGGVILTRRAEVDEAFRHPEVFSSSADLQQRFKAASAEMLAVTVRAS